MTTHTDLAMTIGSAFGGNGSTDVDLVAEVMKLKALKAEYRQLEGRMAEIKDEVKAAFSALNSLSPDGMEAATNRSRGEVEKPRPVSDKLSIAAGRAITLAKREGKSADECRKLATAAANQTALKYGVKSLPSETIALIEKKIKLRFNL